MQWRRGPVRLGSDRLSLDGRPILAELKAGFECALDMSHGRSFRPFRVALPDGLEYLRMFLMCCFGSPGLDEGGRGQ